MDLRTREWLESIGMSIDATDREAEIFLQMVRDSGEPIPSWVTVKATPARSYNPGRYVSPSVANRNVRGITGGSRISVGATGFEKLRAEVVAGLMHRLEVGGELNQFSYTPLTTIVSDLHQAKTGNRVEGKREAAGQRALSTSDLPNILGEVSSHVVQQGYDEAEENWHIWTKIAKAPDFKPTTLIRLSELPDLQKLDENGEYKTGTISDAGEVVQMSTYAIMLKLSREMLINDELDRFSSILTGMGESVNRLHGDLSYNALILNNIMRDGIPLFHADHKNIGTPAAVGVDSISEAIRIFRTQKDLQGLKSLNKKPYFFMAPVALEGAAEVFFSSIRYDDANPAATRANPYAGGRFTRVYDARLDAVSETAWYMSGKLGTGVKMFFLDGQEKPFVDQEENFNSDGITFKVRHDAAAVPIDHRGLLYNAGA